MLGPTMPHPADCDCEFCCADELGVDDAGYCVHCGARPGAWGVDGCDCCDDPGAWGVDGCDCCDDDDDDELARE